MTMAPLEDKPVALVTGANQGLGKEVVRQLGRCGMTVYLGSRDMARGAAAAEELAAESPDIVPLRVDVTNAETLALAAETLGARHGRLDVLVANAGVLHRMPALETTAANMMATYDTNVFGVVRTIEAMLPLLRSARHPRVVTLASTSASLALSSDPATMFGRSDTIVAYASSKAAVTMLTVQYANAFRRQAGYAHIKINAATPGHIATGLNDYAGTRTVEQGAAIVLTLATLPDDGPSGGFFNDAGSVPWYRLAGRLKGGVRRSVRSSTAARCGAPPRGSAAG